jgi:hypothetical protein
MVGERGARARACARRTGDQPEVLRRRDLSDGPRDDPSVNGPAGASLFFTYGRGRTAANSVSGGSDWNPTPSLDLYPSGSGWQMATCTFKAGLNRGVLQVYDLYIDPYSRG